MSVGSELVMDEHLVLFEDTGSFDRRIRFLENDLANLYTKKLSSFWVCGMVETARKFATQLSVTITTVVMCLI